MASGAFAEDEALLIHHAIHSGAKTVALGKDEVYPITKSTNGCLSVRARGWTFMEQNVAKSSAWAKRAQAGDKITWVPSRGAWALLVNGRIEKYNVAIDRGRMAGVKLDPTPLANVNAPGGLSMQPGTTGSAASAAHALVKQESEPPVLNDDGVHVATDDDGEGPRTRTRTRRAANRAATARGVTAAAVVKVKAEPMSEEPATRKRSRASVAAAEVADRRDVPETMVLSTAEDQIEEAATPTATATALISGTVLVTQPAVTAAPLVDPALLSPQKHQIPAADEVVAPARKKILSDEERRRMIEAAGSQFIEIDYQEIQMNDVLGEGASGTVHLAVWKDKQVAVKVLKNQHVPVRVRRQFLQEMILMSQLHHPNIVEFIGASTDPMALTTAFYKHGSLHNYLHARQPRVHLSLAQQLRFCEELCQGLLYLHSQATPIIHRDLKPANVLLDDGLHIRLADFGLSRSISESVTMTGCIGTPHYMAPEVIHENRYTEKADIYSVGIMFYEIATGEIPYRGFNTIQIALKVIGGLRPVVPDYVPPAFRTLIQECWCADPEQRPTTAQVLGRLHAIAAQHGLSFGE